ncbi:BadF/BadG/BcrA/BcrD ATPase family protein [Roseimaritima multifibrata]|uniref:BadF/BadG/BcrA/BcrD ATPase family protein n=1 Tax=Roseimaritima multifibrata TaxID=1930274 RepID=A0A517MFE7_9BACT|nr:BadF/BadG/BcrA/BcrD ATPase family protein [Roseimaritima multifibrata]QDS93613.1 BadF/BadG/BcrA/BcrD ATPase family protein [Roseimaritima multifibrata]
MNESQQYVLGVDGGGSKTVAWLVERSMIPPFPDSQSPDSQGADPLVPLGIGRAAGSNVRTVGMEAATQHLRQAVEAAFADAGIEPRTVAAACFGLAGAEHADAQIPFQDWAEQEQIAYKTIITNDAEPILHAEVEDGYGIALIAGTGSFSLGENAYDRVRNGGWGPLFGDEGSGYAIALDGLRAATRFADGRGPKTKLLAAFLERLELDEVSDLVGAMYRSSMDRRQIAELGEVVFMMAPEDRVAEGILQRAAVELALLVHKVANQLEDTEHELPVLLTGGVLINHPAFQERLVQTLKQTGWQGSRVYPVPNPVAGAVRIAAKNC